MMLAYKMKALGFIRYKEKRKVWLRAFHIWQLRPHEVAPLSEVTHTCSSCGTTFQGNYCPRCGQSAVVGRFSFKNALLLFLDVWGMGNRSMFRSLRDLILRPGYMIRDYLRGMQSAYFPPFKMFFLLTAFALIVQHGFNLSTNEAKEQVEKEHNEMVEELEQRVPDDNLIVNGKEVKSPMYNYGVTFAKLMNKLREKNPAIFALLSLVMFSMPLYFFLRSSPTIPDLRYSEFVVALVYTSCSYSIFSIAGNLLDSTIFKLMAVLMIFVALHQFSGYSKRRLLAYLVLTFIISVTAIAVIAGIGIYLTYLTTLPAK